MIYIIYELTMASLLTAGTYVGTKNIGLTIGVALLCILWASLHSTIFKFEGVY